MKHKKFSYSALTLAISSIILVGCGGGGGNGASTPAQTTPIPTTPSTPSTTPSTPSTTPSTPSTTPSTPSTTPSTPSTTPSTPSTTPSTPSTSPEPSPVDNPNPMPTSNNNSKVKVGVMDTGTNAKSSYLKDQVSKVIKYSSDNTGAVTSVTDITDKTPAEMDLENHGTFVSTIIAGNEVNDSKKGAANGVADIYAGQIAGSDGNVVRSTAFEAMRAMQKQYGVSLFNASFGAQATGQSYEFDIESKSFILARNIVNNGGLIVFGTANDGLKTPSGLTLMPVYDSSLEKGFLSVAGLNETHTALDKQSNACGASARWCLSADFSNSPIGLEANNQEASGLYNFRGTSGSAPQITATAALVWAQNPWLTADQVRQIILTTATYMDDGSNTGNPYNATYGWGYFNTASALKGIKSLNKIFGDNFNANVTDGQIGTFSNDINGDAGLTKSGKGWLMLTGNNTYAGNTVVNEGVLKVDGKVKSDTLVSNGGVLLGSGMLGNVNNSGVVSTEYGSMTTGNFKQNQDGKLIYGINNAITAQGTAQIDGSLEVYAKERKMITKGDHTVITATQGLTGTFAKTSSISPFLKLVSVNYDNNNATANIDFADTTQAGLKVNGVATVAGAITNKIMASADTATKNGESNALTNYVANLQTVKTNGDAQAVLNSNSGAMFVEAPSVLLNNQAVLNNQVAQRTQTVSKMQGGVWASVDYAKSALDLKNWNNVDSKTTVSTVGFDQNLGLDSKDILGGYLSQQHSTSSFGDLNSRTTSDLFTVGLYGKVVADNGLQFAANTHYSKGDIEFDRTITDGVNNGNSHSKADAETAGAYTEIGYNFGKNYIWSALPYFGVSYDYISIDGLKEANTQGLSASKSDANETKTHVGFRLEYALTQSLNVSSFAEYAHALNRSLPSVNIASNLDSSASVNYATPNFDKNAVSYGIGLNYTTPNDKLAIFGTVSGTHMGTDTYQGQVGLKYKF